MGIFSSGYPVSGYHFVAQGNVLALAFSKMQVPGDATNTAYVEGFFYLSYVVLSVLSGAIQDKKLPTVVANVVVWPRGSPKEEFAPLIISFSERWDEICAPLGGCFQGLHGVCLTALQTSKCFFYLFPLSPGIPDSL